jgi:protein SCO1/2
MSGTDSADLPPGGACTGSRGRRRLGAVLLGVAAGIALGIGILIVRNLGDLGSPAPPRYGEVPPFALVAETGDSLSSDVLAGTVWLADFIFTRCPDVCPLLARRFEEIQSALATVDGWMLLSFTIDPGYDTPAILDAYAREHGADPKRWRFVTGDIEDIRRVVVDGFHLAIEKGESAANPIVHSRRIALVDAEGEIRGLYDSGDDVEMRTLLRDTRGLLGRLR